MDNDKLRTGVSVLKWNNDTHRRCQDWINTRFQKMKKTNQSLVVHECIQDIPFADDLSIRRSAGCRYSKGNGAGGFFMVWYFKLMRRGLCVKGMVRIYAVSHFSLSAGNEIQSWCNFKMIELNFIFWNRFEIYN